LPGQGTALRFVEFFTVTIRNRDRLSHFRATGITDYLTNGGRIEVAQRMAGHSNAKTTGLYDRRDDDVSVGEVERIGI
jgi:integrase